MHPELEKYIDFAVADGEVTDDEKAILVRKAGELGVELDELEMVLNAKLHMNKKENEPEQEVQKPTPPPPIQPEQSSGPSKCPECQAVIESFSTRCAYCDAEIKNVKSADSVVDFFNRYNDLAKSEPSVEDNPLQAAKQSMAKLMSGQGLGGPNKQQKELVRNFPVPNSKEDILEFLSLAVPRAKKMGGGFFMSKIGDDAMANMEHNAMVPIWKSKCEQIIIKARFSMKDDRNLLDEIESYAKELGIK